MVRVLGCFLGGEWEEGKEGKGGGGEGKGRRQYLSPSSRATRSLALAQEARRRRSGGTIGANISCFGWFFFWWSVLSVGESGVHDTGDRKGGGRGGRGMGREVCAHPMATLPLRWKDREDISWPFGFGPDPRPSE